ncbi:MAG: hypothetical protein A3F40_02365 [Chlamydiae bacterium RIFCSPHIGHO2_12_FULL_27_8]|nr:MAG: hypothetical protein A3F40_02365 [Chlamydiae bacterium RIFCSPHIGHO2_12_FULL_27_8]
MKKYFLLILILTSCFKNHLYVQHEKLDKNYLASTHIGSPDPRMKNPPSGQRISIAWDFPLSVFRNQELTLMLSVRFWDNTENLLVSKIERKRGYKIYKFQDDTIDKTKKILTYKVDVVNQDGKIVDVWKHQFWKKLIKINSEEHIETIVEEDLIL